MKIKAVIFDLDGTLYDNSRLPFLIALHSLKRLRILADERLCRRRLAGTFLGEAPSERYIDEVSAFCGRDRNLIRDWYQNEYLPLQARLLGKFFKPKPWVLSELQELRKSGILLACFSDYGYIAEKLAALGIDPLSFDLLADSVSYGGPKPCKEAVNAVLDKLGVSAEEALMVGDRKDTDGLCAEISGMSFILVGKKDKKKPEHL